MSYYLTSMESHVLIKKENIEKLPTDFDAYLSLETDDEGNIVEIWSENLKYNFDDLLQDAAPLFEKGSYIDLVGEEGNPFRLVFDGKTMHDISGTILFPKTEEEDKMVEELRKKFDAGLLYETP